MNSCQFCMLPLTKERNFDTSNNSNRKLHISFESTHQNAHPLIQYPQLNYSFQTAFHQKNHN
ncbi:hypothetical protein ACJIZ3_024359 [Penstemon smallii]|uniref:Uncharacterized protein n=1 Tax=Penstemon smallii TaxID=265156 RepID=A0ABD3TTN0_9LAMI